MAQHPDSKWVQEARIRIENFAQSGASPAGAAVAASAAAGAPVASVAPGATSMPSKTSKAAKDAKASKAAPHVATTTGAHYVQLGAYHSQAGAESQWKRLSGKYARELATLTPRYVAGKVKSKPVVRLQVGGGLAGAGHRAVRQAACARPGLRTGRRGLTRLLMPPIDVGGRHFRTKFAGSSRHSFGGR